MIWWRLLHIKTNKVKWSGIEVLIESHNTCSLVNCEISLKSDPGTNKYLAIRVKFLAQGNKESLCWPGSKSHLTDNQWDMLPTEPCHLSFVFTLMVLQEWDCWLEDCRLVHLLVSCRYHCTQFIYQHVELISSLLFTQVTI